MRSKPHPVDVHVGHRIRQQRSLAGFSQAMLGEAAGITFQQVQKYENGSNRCSASMLVTFAKALDVPVVAFFKGAPGLDDAPRHVTCDDDPMLRRETLELVRAYWKIGSAPVRLQLFETVKTVAKAKVV